MKTERPDLHVLVTEEHSSGYYHLDCRIVVQKFEDHQWTPYGDLRDDYDGPLYAHLRIRCQGDSDSRTRAADREQVYGFTVDYQDQYSVDVRKAERMYKTLKTIATKMEKIQEARGYVRSFGEYIGRVAEAIGAKGIGIDHGRAHNRVSGQRYQWQTIGEGINSTNALIWRWVEDGKPKPATTDAA
jgi:hypothetical protein